MSSRVLVVAALAAVAGCGDDVSPGPVCPIDDLYANQHYCASAAILALRDIEHYVLRQDDVDRYYSRLRLPLRERSILRYTKPQGDAGHFFLVESQYPPLVEAWSSGQLRIGEDRVDRWFADAGATEVRVSSPDVPRFAVHWEVPVSHRVLTAGVEEIPDTRTYPQSRSDSGPDVDLVWSGDDAVITFRIGWGDCVAGCMWMHSWRATVTSDDDVTIEDLGGDPVPETLEQRAADLPPPP
jgi:hypothetical protein